MTTPIRRCRLLLLPALCALAGCTLVQLRDEARDYEASTVLVGRIECGAVAAQTVVVSAYTAETPRPAVVHHTRLHECGGYELVVPAGRYGIAAFADRNGNGRFDAGEALAEYAGPAPVQASGTGVVAGLDLVLAAAALPSAAAARATTLGLDRLPLRLHSTQAGALADIDAEAFSAEQASQGYWAPMSFFRRHGGNVYFLEPYDPGRTPVLFVHGAAGSPQDFRPLLAALDRSRYQAWVFHYPSGAGVDSMAHLLYWKLLNLHVRHGYTQLAVVAHSMGGLVVRTLLAGLGPELPAPRLFVSISTPWGGEVAAELGVRHAPAVVPSWHDMRPDGPFMTALFRKPLPSAVDHVLLFGHKGGYSLLRPTTDGTVTLASQLRPEAQAQARRVLGFDEDHTSILASPQLARVLGGVLDAALQGEASRHGEVQVTLERPATHPLGLPMLRLKPLDGRGPPLALLLGSLDERRALGPIPPGRYEASIVVSGFAGSPRRVPVDIVPGQLVRVGFALQPQGSLSGYVAEAGSAAPVVAGARLPPLAGIRIRAVTLQGPGVRRRLQPRPDGSPEQTLDRLIDGEDDATASLFSFVDLPEGEYELVIEADGYRVHRSRHRVVPGRPAPLSPVLMQPG